MSDPFAAAVDPIFLPWAEAKGFKVTTNNMGVRVRWIYLEPPEFPPTAKIGVDRSDDVGHLRTYDSNFKVWVRLRTWEHCVTATRETFVSVLDQQLALLKSRCAASN